MSSQLAVYITPPATDRAPWRVRCSGRPMEEFREEQDAIRRAADCVRMAESSGGSAVVKIERPDGSWEPYNVGA